MELKMKMVKGCVPPLVACVGLALNIVFLFKLFFTCSEVVLIAAIYVIYCLQVFYLILLTFYSIEAVTIFFFISLIYFG